MEVVFPMTVERLGSIVEAGSTPFRMILVDVMVFSVNSNKLCSLFVSGFGLPADGLLAICSVFQVLCQYLTW